MNGLIASPRRRTAARKQLFIPWVMNPPNDTPSVSTRATTGESHDDVEEESLDGMDEPPRRDVVSFFRPFASKYSDVPLQPIAIVQSRYNAVHHSWNKQAQHKSIKSWFRCSRSGPMHDPWWTSDIVVPGDVASTWNVNPVHGSGEFPLSKCDAELLSNETEGYDLLFDLCGDWKSCSNSVQFKSKKGAQRSAALNLLIALDIGGQPDRVGDSSDSYTTGGWNGATAEDSISTRNEASRTIRTERFQLQSIRYFGAVRNPDAKFISNRSPCMVQCVVSIKDVNCNELNESCIEVSSDFHHRKNDSFNGAFDELKFAMLARGATVEDIDNARSAMMRSGPNIAYEVTIPRWATANIESKCYLLELDFLVIKEGNEIPFSDAIGLDASAAARVGIMCGCAVYDDGFDLRDRLSADFTLSSSCWLPPLTSVPDDNVRVKMINQTEVTFSEMIQQMERTSPDMNLEDSRCPVTLTKCFNIILFEGGKTYGMGPAPGLSELLKRVAESNLVPGDRRSCMFVPLRPRSKSEICIQQR
jgi:hypothetical protein